MQQTVLQESRHGVECTVIVATQNVMVLVARRRIMCKRNASQDLLSTEVHHVLQIRVSENLFQQRMQRTNNNACWYSAEITTLASEHKQLVDLTFE